jgi:hypothetical protein
MLHTAMSALKYYLALGSCAVVALCTLYVAKPTARSNASRRACSTGNFSTFWGARRGRQAAPIVSVF